MENECIPRQRLDGTGRAKPGGTETKGHMLSWAVVFLIVAIIAAIFGFTGIAGTAVGIAKILFAVFLVLFLISLILGRRRTV